MNKLLIIVPNDNLGGAEQFLKMIAESFNKSNYFVDVFFLKMRISGSWNTLESENFKLHFTKNRTEKFGVLSLLCKLLISKNKNYDYVFTSHIHLNSFVDILRRLKIINCKWHIARESTSIFKRYSGMKLFMFNSYYRIGYKKIDLLICQTYFMQEQLRNGAPYLFKRLKVSVIKNPINAHAIKNSVSDKIINYSNFIVSAGRLIPEKGFDILINAFHKIHNDNPQLQLVILGEGDLREQLNNLIISLNLQGVVHIPGYIKNVYPYFKKAEVCVVSSRIEGFPNVLLQMMSQNEKVVSTLCAGGIDELKGVETCPVEDSEKLYETIIKTINKDTTMNRSAFDEELKERSIENFISKIRHILSTNG